MDRVGRCVALKQGKIHVNAIALPQNSTRLGATLSPPISRVIDSSGLSPRRGADFDTFVVLALPQPRHALGMDQGLIAARHAATTIPETLRRILFNSGSQ